MDHNSPATLSQCKEGILQFLRFFKIVYVSRQPRSQGPLHPSRDEERGTWERGWSQEVSFFRH